MMTENAGIFVCRTRHLVLAGGSKVDMFSFYSFMCSFYMKGPAQMLITYVRSNIQNISINLYGGDRLTIF